MKGFLINYLLWPSFPYFLASFLITLFIFTLLIQDWSCLVIVASAIGIYGTFLTGREIFRKGIDRIVYEARHIDCGKTCPDSEERREDKQTDADAKAKACGTILILISAFCLFFKELFIF
jgi:hypothetical protein